MRGGAESRNRNLFPSEIRRRLDIGAGNQALQSRLHRRCSENGVRPPQRRANDRVAPADRELNLAGDQRANHPRGAAADDDDFGVETMLFEKAFFFRNPDAARGRADGA